MKETCYVVYCESLKSFLVNNTWGMSTPKLLHARKYPTFDAANERAKDQTREVANGSHVEDHRFRGQKFVAKAITLSMGK